MAQNELKMYRRVQILPHNASEPANPLTWWQTHETHFPMLAKLAKQFLCIPATSAPSERIFSAAGNVLTKKRNRLKPDMASVLVFLHKSWTYMEQYKGTEIEELSQQLIRPRRVI